MIWSMFTHLRALFLVLAPLAASAQDVSPDGSWRTNGCQLSRLSGAQI